MTHLGEELRQFFSSPNRRLPELEPEDLVQMTMTRVYQSMGNFRHDSTLRTWVFRIATNTWRNTLRDAKAKKRTGDEVPLDAAVSGEGLGPTKEIADQREDALQAILSAERTQALWQAIHELPTKMGRCLMLSMHHDYTPRQIATLMKIEENTVKSHLQEGRRRLGPMLRQRFGIPEPEGSPL